MGEGGLGEGKNLGVADWGRKGMDRNIGGEYD